MKKSKIVKRLSESITPHRMCRVFMDYDGEWYINYFPLKVNEKFFLGAVEFDFQLDGFRICPVSMISKAKIRKDKCLEIDVSEGVVDQLYTPKVNISGWKQIFRSLKEMNRYITVGVEDFDYIGAIVGIKKHSVILKVFDADGVWQDEPVKIRFKDIQMVSFASRYVDVFSKYVPKL